ncbi:putative AC9 transposase [Sparassis crispa]|uniref:Putative AC9 transposase n=1 Tax=Sparassis crispa TaxID=139825 RepID=A0A401H192_9APHY|nr:putative AC9 transposase [Sparassis crispa]GBE88184.1 putative AC9 transposase [Sparassis crispa]
MLQEFDGELNFATDAWTLPNNKAIMLFMVHLHHKGVPLRMVLNVVEVAESHSSVNLAVTFAKMTEDFNITMKLLGVTADNATSNDIMIDELVKLIDSFKGQANRSHCFDHIINLVAKTLLRQFDVVPRKATATLDEAEKVLLELAKDLEVDVNEEDAGEEDANDLDGWQDDVHPVKLVLIKLRKIANAIIHSSTKLLPAWLKVLAELDLPERNMPRDAATRWNYTFRMLQFMLEYRKAINEMTKDRSRELCKYELSDEEWRITEQLHDVLKPCIRAAIGLTKKTLNCYYSKTDHSSVYRIAMVLHPTHKLDYFKHAGWEQQWIDMAEELVRDEFKYTYAHGGPDATSNDAHEPVLKNPSVNMFDNLLKRHAPDAQPDYDKIMRYLAMLTEDIDDALG